MQLNKKGSFAVITAIGAIALLLFIINGSINVSQTNNSFLKMQAGREAVLDAENAVRIYDKAIESEIKANADNEPSCTSTLDAGTLESALNSLDFCEARNITISSGASPAGTGLIVCEKEIDGFKITEERKIKFNKTVSAGTVSCVVSD